jgi:putative ABC transport system permease protein
MARPPFYERLYRALLSLFPSEFRGDFGDAMTADFRDQRRDVEGKPREVQRLWLRTTLDVLRQAPGEHADVLRRDAVHAFRVLAKHPIASATAVLSLAIGIGLNTAVYSVVSGVLWRSLPFLESDRLVSIGSVTPSEPRPAAVRDRQFLDLRERTQTLAAMGGFTTRVLTIIAPGEPTHVACPAITDGLFETLAVRPALGQVFSRSEYQAAHALRAAADPATRFPIPAVVILSDTLWRSRFGADPDAVGSYMTVSGGDRLRIIGVMGPELEAMERLLPGQCWVPDAADRADHLQQFRRVIGRLHPDRSIAELDAELELISGKPETDYVTKEPVTLRAMPVLEHLVSEVRTQLLFLFGAVVCVLLVTCANIVNLFLAHGAGRRNELATRVALGASRIRLIRQSLTESLVLSLLGGAGGFFLAVWTLPLLVTLAPSRIPRLDAIAVDWSTFVFTLVVSVAVGIVCAVLAAIPTTAAPRAVFGSAQAATTPRTTRIRNAVTVCEIALALLLAVAASLMVRTVQTLNAIDLGFDPRGVVSVSLPSRFTELHRVQDQHVEIVERIKALPEVRAAGIGLGPLGSSMGLGGIMLPGSSQDLGMVNVDAVSPGYFEALGARLLAGRWLDSRDVGRKGPMVILVNEAAARKFWSGSDAVGKVLRSARQEFHVIGVVANLRGVLDEEPGPTIYQVSNQSQNFLAGGMLIRVEGDADALVPAIRSIIRSVDPEQPFSGVRPLQERLDEAMAPRLFVLRLIGLFSVLGVLLAVVGVYGVLAEFVAQRVPEIGVRMAFGATASDVLTLVLAHGGRLVAAGLVLGVAGAIGLRNVMSTMVYGVQTLDPFAYAAACLLLCAATIAACAVPAKRASRLDPAVALRSE